MSELHKRHPNLAYLHAIEPRVQGTGDRIEAAREVESNDFLRAIWNDKPWISAGGFTRDNAIKHADEQGELVAFGRYYTSNVRFAPVIFRLLFCAQSFIRVLARPSYPSSEEHPVDAI